MCWLANFGCRVAGASAVWSARPDTRGPDDRRALGELVFGVPAGEGPQPAAADGVQNGLLPAAPMR